MPATAILIATAVIALGAGIAGGWFMGRRQRDNADTVLELEARLEKALESRADYEAEVAEHFAQTAELMHRLTEDYRSVYNHLAKGASSLCDGAVDMPTPSLEAAEEAQEIPASLLDVSQPLDYAPRRNPEEQGQLSETFGLDRSANDGEAASARGN